MAGNPHPVYQTGVSPDKSNAIAYTAFVVPNADYLRSLDASGMWVVYVRALDAWFERDTGDTTSADNGATVIVGPNGERWLISQSISSGIISVAGPLSSRDDFDDVAPPFTYYATDTGLFYVKNSSADGDWSDGISLTGPQGIQGQKGWAPVLGTSSDGERRVHRVVDWVGGQGSKPATGQYIGASGLVTDIEDGVDIRGEQGIQGNQGPQGQGLDFDVQVDTLADRDDYDDEDPGFRVLVSDVGDGRAAIYSMGDGGSADWSAPAYVTGADAIVSLTAVEVTASDTITSLEADGNVLVVTADEVTLTLDAPADLAGVAVYIKAQGYDVTVDGGGADINGDASVIVPDGTGVLIVSDGTAFYTLPMGGGGGSAADITFDNTTAALPGDPDNVQDAIEALAAGSRETLTADRTYYVDGASGNDSNDGLSSGAGAFATIQKAVDTAATLDLSIYNVTINVAAGTYAEAVALKGLIGAGRVILSGDATTPSNVTINAAGVAIAHTTGTGVYEVRGFRLQATGSCLRASGAGAVIIGDKLEFHTASEHVFADFLGSIFFSGQSYAITGNAGMHWRARDNGYIAANGATITLTGTPAFSGAFANCETTSIMRVNGVTFSGSATGTRYNVSTNAVIQTNGGGASYLPGNSGGTAATGGQYA